MRELFRSLGIMALALGVVSSAWAAPAEKKDKEEQKEDAVASQSILDRKMKDIDGNEVNLKDKYAGKVVMIVNVASKCGLTPQYTELEALYEKYKDKGFVILGMPANNFGAQEPGTNAEIKEFCSSTYKVQFPMFSKISVKGDDIDPLYKVLTDEANGGEIKWNFTKFLIGKDGKIAARFEPRTKPNEPQVVEAIESAIEAPAPAAGQ